MFFFFSLLQEYFEKYKAVKVLLVCKICIGADLKHQPSPLSSCLAPFSRRSPMQDGRGLYLQTEPEEPESQRGQTSWHKCSAIFRSSKEEATCSQCFIPLVTPFPTPLHFSPFLPFFQVLILWASAYLCGCFLSTKNEKHNRGKGK